MSHDESQIIVVERDITARKKAEEELHKLNAELGQRIQERTRELRQTTEHVQTILDNSPEVLLFLCEKGTIKSINPALEATFGYHLDEVIGQSPFILFDRRQASLWMSALHDVIRERSNHRIDIRARRKDGTFFDADVMLAPVEGEGELLGMVFSLRDVSAFKDVERMKDAIVSTAAHELRTPLTSIQGFSEILLTRELEEDRRRRYLEFINERSMHLAAIVNDLLDISRLESGSGLEINPQPIDLTPLIDESLRPFIETYDTHYFVSDDFPPRLMVKGDPLRLSQVITNLLSNAVKYSPDGGEVAVRGTVNGSIAEISVEDSGLGIPAEHLPYVFDRFYRVDVSNQAIGGTGLGLTICKLIVEGHGGQIRVESKVGEGSTFTVTLPLAADAEDSSVLPAV
jgi:PAS domain S-box-containing protein